MRDGSLLFTDIPDRVVNRWTADGKVMPYLQFAERAGYNGLTVDKQGRLILCERWPHHGACRTVPGEAAEQPQ